MTRKANKKLNLEVQAYELNGSYFDNIDGKELVERKMLGALDKINTFQIENVRRSQVLDNIVENLRNYAGEIAERHMQASHDKKSSKVKLRVNLIMHPDKEKNIKIMINDLKLYLVTAIYLQLIDFSAMDDSVNPPPPEQMRKFYFSNVKLFFSPIHAINFCTKSGPRRTSVCNDSLCRR